jgi:Domain of unknown function (DUF4388)
VTQLEAFQVRLGNYRLAKLMPALCEGAHVSGTLMLERGRTKREFTFRDGDLVTAASSSPREHLSQVLTDLGILDAGTAASAFAAAEAAHLPFAQHLLRAGLVPRERLLEALEHKARECLFDCYAWESGDLWFLPRRSPYFGVEMRLPLAALHRDALARLEEWNEFRVQLPDLKATFEVKPAAVPPGLAPEAQALLAEAASGKRLQELLELSRESTLVVARRLLELYRLGALLPAREPPRPPQGDMEAELEEARRALSAGDYERAVEVSLKALSRTNALEAHELYRFAEVHLARHLGRQVAALEGRLSFRPVPVPPPPELTSDDLYLYSKLKGAPSVVEAVRRSSAGELAGARSLFRLISCGVITVSP